jgi:Ca2+-binding EF-hand superfamily protein
MCNKGNGSHCVKGEDILAWFKNNDEGMDDNEANQLLTEAVERGFLTTQDRSNLEEAVLFRLV